MGMYSVIFRIRYEIHV